MVVFRLLVIAFLFVGCASRRVALVEQRDSVAVELRQRDVVIRDTVVFAIEYHRQRVIERKDSSFLRNPYAISEAVILSDGTLRHTLESLPQELVQGHEFRAKVRDSIVYRDRVQVKRVEVERDLRWWEEFQIGGFRLLALLLCGGVLVRWILG